MDCNFLLQADTLTGAVTCTGHLALALHCELLEKFPQVTALVAQALRFVLTFVT